MQIQTVNQFGVLLDQRIVEWEHVHFRERFEFDFSRKTDFIQIVNKVNELVKSLNFNNLQVEQEFALKYNLMSLGKCQKDYNKAIKSKLLSKFYSRCPELQIDASGWCDDFANKKFTELPTLHRIAKFAYSKDMSPLRCFSWQHDHRRCLFQKTERCRITIQECWQASKPDGKELAQKRLIAFETLCFLIQWNDWYPFLEPDIFLVEIVKEIGNCSCIAQFEKIPLLYALRNIVSTSKCESSSVCRYISNTSGMNIFQVFSNYVSDGLLGDMIFSTSPFPYYDEESMAALLPIVAASLGQNDCAKIIVGYCSLLNPVIKCSLLFLKDRSAIKQYQNGFTYRIDCHEPEKRMVDDFCNLMSFYRFQLSVEGVRLQIFHQVYPFQELLRLQANFSKKVKLLR